MSGGAEERQPKHEKVTFATIDGQVHGGLLTRSAEVPPPKHNIFTTKTTY
jgi:hypothetical protein